MLTSLTEKLTVHLWATLKQCIVECTRSDLCYACAVCDTALVFCDARKEQDLVALLEASQAFRV